MLGVITGSGLYELPGLGDPAHGDVSTPYGDATVTRGTWHGQPVAFVARHGSGHTVAPHAINYRANVWALQSVGVTDVLATAVSGGISSEMAPGRLVLISDVIDFTAGRACTFFDGATDPGFGAGRGVTHTDMTHPYHPDLRDLLRRAAAAASVDVIDGAVYCTTNGPRFETPAEITMMGRLGGDLVGMTGYPEVALANEAGLRYASVGIVSNWAAGIADAPLSADDIFAVISDAGDRLYRLFGSAAELHAGSSA
ncbi:MAG: S-methyl-5'-thioinosine phosphorylase [Actinomycetota bacterium]